MSGSHLKVVLLFYQCVSIFYTTHGLAGQDPKLDAKSMYQRGVKAFHQGQYSRAVDTFLAAKNLGLDIPKLHFNLGSSYFKLEKYEHAFASFHLVIDDPQLAVLARINLALCVINLDKTNEAQQYLQSALSIVRSDRSRKQILGLMKKYGFSPPPRLSLLKWDSNINLMLGHNSNVTLTDIADSQNPDEEDSFTHTVLSTQLSFFNALRTRLDMQAIEYTSLNNYDYGSAKFQLGYNIKTNALILDLAADYQISTLAHRSFLSSYALHTSLNTRTRNRWMTALSFDLIQHNEKRAQYEYLSGTQTNTQLLMTYQTKSISLGFQTAAEFNNRQDSNKNEALLRSYSPTRWLMGVTFNWQQQNSGFVTFSGYYRNSRYPEINELEPRRKDRRLAATISYANKLYKQLWWNFSANYIDNSSNFNKLFGYNSRIFLLGLSWHI